MHWRRKWQPTQCSCLEDPRDGRAWWAAVYGVAQSRTWLKWLSRERQKKNLILLHKWIRDTWERHFMPPPTALSFTLLPQFQVTVIYSNRKPQSGQYINVTSGMENAHLSYSCSLFWVVLVWGCVCVVCVVFLLLFCFFFFGIFHSSSWKSFITPWLGAYELFSVGHFWLMQAHSLLQTAVHWLPFVCVHPTFHPQLPSSQTVVTYVRIQWTKIKKNRIPTD